MALDTFNGLMAKVMEPEPKTLWHEQRTTTRRGKRVMSPACAARLGRAGVREGMTVDADRVNCWHCKS